MASQQPKQAEAEHFETGMPQPATKTMVIATTPRAIHHDFSADEFMNCSLTSLAASNPACACFHT
jgi:hypothetical protein